MAQEERQPKKGTGLYLNKRFNRIEGGDSRMYLNEFGNAQPGFHTTQGILKCTLLHGQGYSLIVPNLIFILADQLRWIQPLGFMANLIDFHAELDYFIQQIDISCGQTVKVTFTDKDLIRTLPDGSHLYRCEIIGPEDLSEYATGDAIMDGQGLPYLQLFHHTTSDSKEKILESKHFRTSKDHIQGVAKKLKHASYAYFTPLDAITHDEDLQMIAMSSEGFIPLLRDGITPPTLLSEAWEKAHKQDFLRLPVYRSETAKREACLPIWVDCSILAPQHVYRHDNGIGCFYEIPNPFIQRIGTEPGCVVEFDNNLRIHAQQGLKAFDYIVVGDCTTLAGLAAPYDEEDTREIMKIERVADGSLLGFWKAQANRDLYTGKSVEIQEFEGP